MSEHDKMELVSAAIDGKLDAEEQDELDTLLETSAEARELRAEFEQMDSMLKKIPSLDPPEFIQDRIMQQLSPRSASREPMAIDWLRQLIPGAGLRYAMAVSSGAILALVFFNILTPTTETADFSDLVGTIAPDATSSSAVVLDTYELNQSDFRSTVQLQADKNVLSLRVSVDAAAPLAITVDMRAAGVEPDGHFQFGGSFDHIEIDDHVLQLQATGQKSMDILLRRVDGADVSEEAKLLLEFSSDGTLLQQGVLTANWKEYDHEQ